MIENTEVNKISDLKICYLSNYASTGNTFFLSLLDGHEEVLNLPGYVDLSFCFENKKSFSEYLKEFNFFNPYFFDTSKMTQSIKNHQGLSTLGENKNQGIIINKDKFELYYYIFSKDLELNIKNIIFSIYYAYAKAIDKNILKLKALIIYPYDHSRTISLIKYLKDDHVIVFIRNPINTYYSYKEKLKLKIKVKKINFDIFNLYNMCRNVDPLIKKNINFKYIKIEDLHKRPELILQNVCNFLDIKFNHSLLDSSFLGKKYWGHFWNKDNLHFSGFNKNYHNVDNYDKLNYLERSVIIILSYKLFKIYDYNYRISFLYLFMNFPLLLLPSLFEIKSLLNSKNKYFFFKKICSCKLRYLYMFIENIFNKKKFKIISSSNLLKK